MDLWSGKRWRLLPRDAAAEYPSRYGMASLLLALIGIPVGLALDALVVRFAAQPDDEDDDVEEAPVPSPFAAETGSLVIQHGAQAWARRALIVGATAGLFATAGARFDHPGDLAIVTAYTCALIICAGTDLLAIACRTR
jgi:hypothetical protein